MPYKRSLKSTLILICVAHILGMVPFAIYPTLIPELQLEWGANNTQIGWVAGIYFGGYLLSVSTVVPLTDRVDARLIYLYSMALCFVAPLAFALFTSGVASASVWRFMQGFGLAGTYMPGLKALVDAFPEQFQSRTVAIYTMCFGLGVGVSFLVAGIISDHMTWQWVFAFSAIGPLLAIILAILFLPHASTEATAAKFRFLPNFRPVFENPKALGFSIAYSVHNMELFVFRSWAVALIVFAMSQREPGSYGGNWNAGFIVACATFLAQPFSVFVNEFAQKTKPVAVILIVMGLTAASGIGLGFSTQAHMLVVLVFIGLYAILTISDSATITSSVIKAARASVRGTTMAFHSLVGFLGAFAGPIIFGTVLDISGGGHQPVAWGVAFVVMAGLVVIGPIAILKLSKT